MPPMFFPVSGILTQNEGRGESMKASLLWGMAAGTALGVAATMAMGGMSTKNMRRMGRKMVKRAHKMGIDL